jgi:hypothetical protein
MTLEIRQFAALFAALAVVASMPILLCETLPLVDYPNHLARMHILSALPSSEPLQKYYEAIWNPLPNLAMELVVVPLAHALPVAVAGKIFVLLGLVSLSGGAVAVHRVLFGKWSAWPLLSFLLLYNNTLLWGLTNYIFTVGLSLFALALWISLRFRPWLRLALGTAAALILFFCHLLAFGLYGLLAIGYEAGALLRERPRPFKALRVLFLGGAPFLPPVAIYLLITPKAGGGQIVFGQIADKAGLLFNIFNTYNLPFDWACFALVVLATGYAYFRGWVWLHPAMGVPLCILFLAFLAMPDELATASGADRRIPLILALAAIASTNWAGPAVRTARVFAWAALLMFLVRLVTVCGVWLESDRLYAQLLAGLDLIPPGSRVAVANPVDTVKFPAPPLHHFPALAVIRRDVFMPTLFAHPAQQPLAFRQPYAALAARLDPVRLFVALVEQTEPLDADEQRVLSKFDYVVFEARQPFTLPVSGGLAPVFTSPRLVVARLCSASSGQ